MGIRTIATVAALAAVSSVSFGQGYLAVQEQGELNQANGTVSVVSGGAQNVATGNFSVIGGGGANQTIGEVSVIGGGAYNVTTGSYAAILGGAVNSADPVGAVGGGAYNSADVYGTVAGGAANIAGALGGVLGGAFNVASGFSSAVLGGFGNTALGIYSVVLGGEDSRAVGARSLAWGTRAVANTDGSVVFADSQDEDYATTVPDQFAIRARGGIVLNGTVSPVGILAANLTRNGAGDLVINNLPPGNVYHLVNETGAPINPPDNNLTAIFPVAPAGTIITIINENVGQPSIPNGGVVFEDNGDTPGPGEFETRQGADPADPDNRVLPATGYIRLLSNGVYWIQLDQGDN